MTATQIWEGDPLRVSNSEIQTFKDCRRKWWFVYYRELGLNRGAQQVTGPRSIGTCIHLSLEGYYERDDNPIEVLKGLYDSRAIQLKDQGREDDAAEVYKEYDLAHAMLTGYLEWAQEKAIDAGLKLIASESVIEVKSSVPGVFLRGKLDQRWERESDGAHLFRDFKTVGNLTDPPKILPMDEQMKFYQLLEFLEAMELTGGEPQWRTDGGLYTMLRKVKRTAAAKPPFYGQLEVHHNMTEIRNMWMRVAKIIEEIVETRKALDAGGDHHYLVPPRPSRDCTWKCDFFTVCNMHDDGSNVEPLMEAMYEHLDPHLRYQAEESKGDGDNRNG